MGDGRLHDMEAALARSFEFITREIYAFEREYAETFDRGEAGA